MRNHMAAGWFYSREQIKRYFATRLSSLKPPRAKIRNPIDVLRDLDRHQWLMFIAGFLGWVWDSFDFITVALCVTEIATEFNTTNSAVTWGITVTLMLRSVGALIAGTLSDRFGRKWILISTLFLFIVFELASGFAQTLPQFLVTRALYGIAMGGLYGPAVATAIEDLPYDARGLCSGLFQQGYSVGGLLAAICYRALVPTTPHGWRSLFWFASIPPVLMIAYVWWLPETNASQVMRAEREAAVAHRQGSKTTAMARAKAWSRDIRKPLKENWFLFVYLVVMLTGFHSVAHGSTDLYPTFLKNQVELDPSKVTIITVAGQLGAVCGGTTIGYMSTFFGRRLSMIVCCIIGAALVPTFILPRSLALVAGQFCIAFFVGGLSGPIPIHLLELSPPELRATAIGVASQLGSLASSAGATIQAIIGEQMPLGTKDGVKRYDYGKAIAIFLSVSWVYVLIFILLGPEMSQEEREADGATADYIETMRRQGMSLSEIGAKRAERCVAGDESPPQGSEKNVDVEHVDDVRDSSSPV